MPVALNTVPDPQQDRSRLLQGRSFAEWSLADARQAIAWVKERRLTADGFTANQLIVEAHDHYMSGGGWIGPDGGSDMAARTRIAANVKRQFTPVDVIAEVLDNVTNALLGTEAGVGFTPVEPVPDLTAEQSNDPAAVTAHDAAVEAQEAEADAMLEALSRWWDCRRLWELARKAEKRARAFTWGTLRAWVPPKAIAGQELADPGPDVVIVPEAESEAAAQDTPAEGQEESGVPLETGLPFADALERILLSAPPAEQAYLYTDPDTQARVAIFLYAAGASEFTELVWIDPASGETVFKQIGNDDSANEVRLDLGGRLPLVQMEADLLITEPVRMQQARLNFIESITVRVMEQAGFPARFIGNAKPQGLWTKTKPVEEAPLDLQVIDGETWYLIGTPMTLGASITTELRGIDRKDPVTQNVVGVETPWVQTVPPTDPVYATNLSRHARATILRQCKQGHLEMSEDGQASGFSRIVAKAPFIADVENNRPPLEGMLRDLIESVIALASLMSPDFAGFLDRFRCVVTAHVNYGPVDPEEQTQILAQVQAGVLSLETALEQLQVEDVGAELERLATEPKAQQAMLTLQLANMNAAIATGMQMSTAAEIAGMSKEQLALIEADRQAFLLAPESTPSDTTPALDAQPPVPLLPPSPAVEAPAPQAVLDALAALTQQVQALASRLDQQPMQVNSPVTVHPSPVTVNNMQASGQPARRMVLIKRDKQTGDLTGEVFEDPQAVTLAPNPDGSMGAPLQDKQLAG